MSPMFWLDISLGLAMAIAGGLLGHSIGWDRGYQARTEEGRR